MYHTCIHSQVFWLKLKRVEGQSDFLESCLNINITSLNCKMLLKTLKISLVYCVLIMGDLWQMEVEKIEGYLVCLLNQQFHLLNTDCYLTRLCLKLGDWQLTFSPADVKDAICTGCNYSCEIVLKWYIKHIFFSLK